jgi:phosphate transport system substrate-binding protein
MVSRELYPQEREMGALSVAVAKDAVVAVINEKNPVAREIILRGVKPEELYTIWISGTSKTWGQITGSDTHSPIHPYTRSDACGAADVWASLMGKKQEDLNGTGVYGDPGLAQAVKQDSLGIGFNNIGYIFNISSGFPIQGLLIVPLDLNSNGIIDDDEKFYNTLTDLTKAIAAGKYPSPPSRQLYFVINGKSEESRVVNGFIEWVLGEGQNFVGESGYVSLSDEILADGRKILR